MMGSPANEQGRDADEGPLHPVTIGKAFAVGRTHVTREEYAEFMRESGHKHEPGCRTLVGNGWRTTPSANWLSPGYAQTDRDPVVCVSWFDAVAYARWLSAKTGRDYRLLSEAEAEYVTRGVTSTSAPRTRFWFGNSEAEVCKYANGADQAVKRATTISPVAPCNDGFAYTAPVGSFRPNAFGLHDVTGNVWTWTQDCWNERYDGAPSDGRAWVSGDCANRALRGAAWSSWPRYLRPATRENDPVEVRDHRTGLRVARSMHSSDTALAEEGVPAQLTHEEIVMVQKKLDALEFRVKVTGVMDDQTKAAIRQLLKENNQKEADYLTSENLAKLKNTDTSSFVYAAIGTSTDGTTATTWNKESRESAESEVMTQCKARSSKPEKCVVQSRSSGFHEGWVASVYCKRTEARRIREVARLVTSNEKDIAVREVYEDALQSGFPKSSCRLTAVIESRGRHKK
jgi:formylglycine-generating enzyme required for sulfatase activity